MKNFVGQRADGFFELVDGDDDLVGRDAAAVRVDGVILQPLHLGALVYLHAVIDQQVLEALQARQRIDAVGAAIANAGGVTLRAENAFQLLLVVGALVGEADLLPAFQLGIHGLLATLPSPRNSESCFSRPH